MSGSPLLTLVLALFFSVFVRRHMHADTIFGSNVSLFLDHVATTVSCTYTSTHSCIPTYMHTCMHSYNTRTHYELPHTSTLSTIQETDCAQKTHTPSRSPPRSRIPKRRRVAGVAGLRGMFESCIVAQRVWQISRAFFRTFIVNCRVVCG